MDFDNMFDDVTEKYEKKVKNNQKKPNKKKQINLFKEIPDKKKLDLDKLKYNDDIAILLYDSSISLPDDVKSRFKEMFQLAKEKGINIRGICKNIDVLLGVFKYDIDKNKLRVIKPWKKYCDTGEDIRVWTPSNKNIELAANYVNNFDKLPVGVKYINSALLTLLFSYTGENLAKYIVVYDPYYKNPAKDKLDYNKSKDTFNLYRLSKNLDGLLSIYNIANESDFKTLMELMEKK